MKKKTKTKTNKLVNNIIETFISFRNEQITANINHTCTILYLKLITKNHNLKE